QVAEIAGLRPLRDVSLLGNPALADFDKLLSGHRLAPLPPGDGSEQREQHGSGGGAEAHAPLKPQSALLLRLVDGDALVDEGLHPAAASARRLATRPPAAPAGRKLWRGASPRPSTRRQRFSSRSPSLLKIRTSGSSLRHPASRGQASSSASCATSARISPSGW